MLNLYIIDIFYLDSGFTGWIKFSNSITKNKFNELIKKLEKELNFPQLSKLSEHQLLNLYDDDYIPHYENKNSVFFYVREPHISCNLKNSLKIIEDYIKYLKTLEGVTDKLKIQNFGFDSFLILDGFFEVPISYYDSFEISISDKKLRTIYKY